jgi:magnesium chelatase subunit H
LHSTAIFICKGYTRNCLCAAFSAVLFAGIKALGGGPAAPWGVTPAAAEISPSQLREMLTFPPDWGPTEWGPIPYLPDNDVLVKRMEAQWGNLNAYRGINSTMNGTWLIPGVQLGKLWVGVQPLLGLEGDPMRLLFERDLTPHPQYAAAYKWLQQVGWVGVCETTFVGG